MFALLWYVPAILSTCVVVVLLLLNLRKKPAKSTESLPIFIVSLISTNFNVIIAQFGNALPIISHEKQIDLVAAGGCANLLSMPFYIFAVLSLGRGLAILPEANVLRMSGVYKFSRHPLYLTYVVWAITQILIYQTWTVIGFSVIQILLLIIRANREETLLEQSFPAYLDYRRKVMWLGIRPLKSNIVGGPAIKER
jgi:protein-S-isoprenylcysteine O-methyltransferase Ste14